MKSLGAGSSFRRTSTVLCPTPKELPREAGFCSGHPLPEKKYPKYNFELHHKSRSIYSFGSPRFPIFQVVSLFLHIEYTTDSCRILAQKQKKCSDSKKAIRALIPHPYFLLFLTIITMIITSLITFAAIRGESTTSHGHCITPSNRRATRITVTSNTRSTSIRFPFFIYTHLPYSKNCKGSTGVPFTWTSK